MPLVVDGVCRFSFEGFLIDRPSVNIWDMWIETTGIAVSREEAIYNLAGNLLNAWVTHLAPVISDEFVLTRVGWVDLDSPNGSTGERLQTSENTLPEAGFGEGEADSGNVAILVTKQTQGGRGTRSGRWYQGGVMQFQAEHNTLVPAELTNIQDAFDGFLAQANDGGLPPVAIGRQAVVVHTTGPNPQVGTRSDVTGLVVQERLATQRRRLRG